MIYLEPSRTPVMVAALGLDRLYDQACHGAAFFRLRLQDLLDLRQASLVLSLVLLDVLFQGIPKIKVSVSRTGSQQCHTCSAGSRPSASQTGGRPTCGWVLSECSSGCRRFFREIHHGKRGCTISECLEPKIKVHIAKPEVPMTLSGI